VRNWLVLVAVVGGGVASANVWQQAIENRPDLAEEEYQNKLMRGDELAKQANMAGRSTRDVRNAVNLAAQAYRDAAKAKPDRAEPYFRLGTLLFSFYFQECGTARILQRGVDEGPLCSDRFDAPMAEQVIAAWNAFEARAPLDPRVNPPPKFEGANLLFDRALLHTKLETRPHLESAARDYEALLNRSDSKSTDQVLVWSNLAETYMMIGNLERAIEAYQVALHSGGTLGTGYGLAVALDRDDRGEEAKQQIRSEGIDTRQRFVEAFGARNIFFVPTGEEQYYFALIAEAYGELDEALAHWRMYLASGAQPQFQPRAKVHIDALVGKLRHRPIVAPPLDRNFFP
jgi:tetratricopeptide (TPR) repeat protein